MSVSEGPTGLAGGAPVPQAPSGELHGGRNQDTDGMLITPSPRWLPVCPAPRHRGLLFTECSLAWASGHLGDVLSLTPPGADWSPLQPVH